MTEPVPKIAIEIQQADFAVAEQEKALLLAASGAGAIASFTGYVRDSNDDRQIASMELEHYPGMTEKSIDAIAREACERWSLLAVKVIHRVGSLGPTERIVYVGVASLHRGDAFAACEYIMDYLKTRAPFWKKEHTEQGERWVAARQSDTEAADRW